jgi:hypothetical protein
MELKKLIGLHTLTGITNESKQIESSWDNEHSYDAQTLSFILDDTIYTALEDENDGYRSCMGELLINKFQCKNTFEPIQVLGIYKEKSGYSTSDILQLYGMDGKLILEVGTDNTDDYYPSFVSNFNPENIR